MEIIPAEGLWFGLTAVIKPSLSRPEWKISKNLD
jgi:hypothetical protein